MCHAIPLALEETAIAAHRKRARAAPGGAGHGRAIAAEVVGNV